MSSDDDEPPAPLEAEGSAERPTALSSRSSRDGVDPDPTTEPLLSASNLVRWAEVVERALEALSEEERALLRSVYLDGYAVDELAERLQQRPRRVAARLGRARLRLRAELLSVARRARLG